MLGKKPVKDDNNESEEDSDDNCGDELHLHKLIKGKSFRQTLN